MQHDKRWPIEDDMMVAVEAVENVYSGFLVGGVHGAKAEEEDIKVEVLEAAEAIALLDEGRIESAPAVVILSWVCAASRGRSPRMASTPMMRTGLVVLFLAASALLDASFALDASDTMAAWKDASAVEKKALVTSLLKRDGREGGAESVAECLDLAADAPGHAGLKISRIFEACAKAQGEPV